MLDALSPQRRRVVLGASALVLAVVIAVVVAVMVRSSGRSDEVPQDQLGPVLLVPGYGGTGASLTPLANALRAGGREPVIVPPVGDGTGDLGQQAEHLGRVAAQVASDAGAPSVDVVGYSAGGVVARLWVRAYGGGALARRVLTLGSPHHGTSAAALGLEVAGRCPPACEQLVPDSDLLRRLNAVDETPDGPLWVTVSSSTDQVVTPVDSATLDGALNLLVQDGCPGTAVSHAQLPSNPLVLAALTSTLGPGEPLPPSAVRC